MERHECSEAFDEYVVLDLGFAEAPVCHYTLFLFASGPYN